MITLASDPTIAEQQIEAVIYYLTTCGYIDSEFDLREKAFVRSFLRKLVTVRVDAQGDLSANVRFEQIERQHEHYVERFQQIDYDVKSLFQEAVADGEDVNAFVMAKLKLHCYELLEGLTDKARAELLEVVDDFINADGQVHPEEVKFRNELADLLGHRPDEADDVTASGARVALAKPTQLSRSSDDHPFFKGFEHHYSSDPAEIRKQIEADLKLLDQAESQWQKMRDAGQGRLGGKQNVGELSGGEFLDGWVHAVPDHGGDYELIVLGDLHGCYSCLKAAVMQSDFMEKVKRRRTDPNAPDVRLVLLGDYIDRGRFAFNGVLRAVLKLFLTVPENVFVLRGNHEYYIEYNGRIYGGVKPADTINSLSPLLPGEVFERYLKFFESIPNSLLYDNLFFVHGGLPREKIMQERWKDLSALNDPDIRFQMLWSDPSRADTIPEELQEASARFPFGRLQFRRFMDHIGCAVMCRGHEKINLGFRDMYPKDDLRLLTIFSAGGVANDDVPEDSNYRDVRPMALTISHTSGETTITPWAIDYRSYQNPDLNAFFREPESADS